MAKKPAKAAETDVPAMDYAMHNSTYELFLAMVKWGTVSMVFLVLALYAFIELHQPLLGLVLLILMIAVPIGGAVMGKPRKPA